MNYEQINKELTKENEILNLSEIEAKHISTMNLRERMDNNMLSDVIIGFMPYKTYANESQTYVKDSGVSLYFANMVSGDVIRNEVFVCHIPFCKDLSKQEYETIFENMDKIVGVNAKSINYGYDFMDKSYNYILNKQEKVDNLKLRLNNLNNLVRNYYVNKESGTGLTAKEYLENVFSSNKLLKFVSKQISAVTISSGMESVEYLAKSENKSLSSKAKELSSQLVGDLSRLKNGDFMPATAARKWVQVQGVVKEEKMKNEIKNLPKVEYDKSVIQNSFELK